MESCDILIVGGGPAGSTCARELCRAGLDVVILDKQAFPRDKTCAGWITPAVVEELGLDPADYASGRVFQPITSFRTGTIGGRAVETHYNKPVSYGIRRCEFDNYLLHRCGARLRLGEKLDSLKWQDGGWIINGSITAPMLVGAGGHFCPVARHLGAEGGKETVVAAQEIEFKLNDQQAADCRVVPQRPELYFCKDLMGYAWCFRKGGFLNIGLGREDNVRLSEHVQEFRGLMIEQGRIPRNTPGKFHGHAYILYGHTERRLFDDAVALVGDAAGLAYAQSGEGIRPAVESGLLAAQTILAANGDYRGERLRAYADRLIQRLGKPAPSGGAPSRFKQALGSLLLETQWFSRHVVINHWFLHNHQAAMADVPITTD